MFTGKLDAYQIPAKKKFVDRGSLLIAYTMGLGKTPIAIASAEKLIEMGKISTVLIVCPASLKYQWAEKIAEFTDLPRLERKIGSQAIIVPAIDCVIIDGNKKRREELYDIYFRNPAGYIIVGYDSVLVDYVYVKKLNPGMVVLDEATAIKSFKAQRSKRIKKLLRSEYRLALTGTPIENRPDELFSIMQWVDEEVLGRYDLFEKAYINRNKYGWIVSYKNLPVLRKRMEPAMSRLTDKDKEVAGFMPESVEKNWLVDMSLDMRELYRHIAKDMLGELDSLSPYADFNITDYYSGIDESKPSGKLMAMYTCLEMLVDHPDLIIWSGMQFIDGRKGGSRYAYNLWQSGAIDNVTQSPKLDRLCSELNSIGHKTLVYSRYKYMLTIINQHIPDAIQFHGTMSPLQKAEAVAKFKKDDNSKIFLSSHAGAYGMDMYMAGSLINYDLPWSAGKQDQINYRHKRRSSAYDTVYVYNMIVKNSFEERRQRILGRKRQLAEAILDGKGSDRVEIDGDSLRTHLEECLRA